jgi:acyl-CoA thioester hydrolase
MTDDRFYQPVEIRYGDIDAQRHVNNARYFTFMEGARTMYVKHLGLWDGKDFDAVGIILVETTCTFKAPINFGQRIQVGVRTVRLGNKSIEMVHSFQDVDSGQEMATGRSVVVAYDYLKNRSVEIPKNWRETIAAFEGIDEA